MLILILFCLAIVSTVLVVIKRNENSLLICGLYCSLILMFSGVIIYTAKIGGLNRAQEVFLFLSPEIKRWIQYRIITLDVLGYIIAIGRYLFPAFFLLIAINSSMAPFIRRNAKWAHLFLLLPVASLVLYFPQVFYVAVRNRFMFQRFLMRFTLIWIIVYIVVAVLLLLKEYFSITMAYFRRQFRYILLSHICLALLYGLYCAQDPIQVYQLYTSEYLWVSGISYANAALPLWGWCLLTVGTILFVALGIWNLFHYTRVNFRSDQEDISLERKFDAASKGISVFVHGIKNQLLSSRVVNKKIDQLLMEENPDLDALRGYTDTLNRLNENMLERMNELYNTVKSNSISLIPVGIETVLDRAIEYFAQKYPEQSVALNIKTNAYVLADKGHLSQAIYNLLINAQDAILAANRGEEGKIELLVYKERLYTVIEIRDNGTGMAKNVQNKAFEPFYTSKNTNYNWGMGLYCVRQIVKSHYGSLRLESVPNKGTSFYIMLPNYNNQTNVTDDR